jgi:hypothetical protein
VNFEHASPEELFPRFAQFALATEQRDYVERTLVELAVDGRLVITDLLRQVEPIRTYCGEVLLGHYVDGEQRHRTDGVAPDEVDQYRVTIESLTDEPITYRFGSRAKATKMLGRQGAQAAVTQYTPNMVETGKVRIQVSPARAWMCLREQGQGAFRANGTRASAVKVREVRPEELKRKRGRPPKAEPAEASV